MPPTHHDHHLRIRQPLHPDPAQHHALDRLWNRATHVWRVLALQARLETAGRPQALREVVALLERATIPDLPPTSGPIPRRSNHDRRQELEGLARDLGWRAELGSATLDGLVQAFGRHLRSLGRLARPAEIPLDLPSEVAVVLGGLAHPVSDHAVEIVGIPGLVLCPLYLLPGPAAAAISTWRAAFAHNLAGTRVGLEAALLAGDRAADADYLAHLARYARLEAHLAIPQVTPALSVPVSLRLAEAAQLHRTANGAFEVSWAFRVADVPPPRYLDLIGIDPGERALWTWVTAQHGHGRVRTPLILRRVWRPIAPTPSSALLQRPADLSLALMLRHRLLFRAHVQPLLEAALAHLLQFSGVAIEETTLDKMALRTIDYAAFVAFGATRVYERFVSELARLDPDRRVAVWVPPEGTSADCSLCGGYRTMRYWHRQGRCRACGGRLDRDQNGARNVYLRAAVQLNHQALPWRPAALPAPSRRR